MSKFVSLKETETGDVRTHMESSHGEVSTLCGLIDSDGQYELVTIPRKKIDCEECRLIFENCQRYRANDFA